MCEAEVEECVFRDDPSLLVKQLLEGEQPEVALTRLDKLAIKELYTGGFNVVLLVLKSLANLSEDQQQTVVNLGLTTKVVLWFEVVCDSLTSDLHGRSGPLLNLTDDFLDYFLLLTKASLPVPELSTILLHLIRLSLKTEIHFPLRLEGVKTLNNIIETLSREQRKLIQTEQSQNPILFQVAAAVLTVGDYELQGSLSEALCRLTPRCDRQERAKCWFSSSDVSSAFCEIKDADFEVDCRHFLNLVNSSQGDQRRVYTLPCLRAFLNSMQLFRPKDNKLVEFWVDFNFESQSVSFFIDEPEASLWGSIHLLKDDVDYYTLHINEKEVMLRARLSHPIMHQGNRGHTVELTFSSEHRSELQKAAEQAFTGISGTVQESPSVKRNSLSYGLKKPRRKSRLKVLPLSSPSSEEDSSFNTVDRRSQAEILFDEIRESTPAAGRITGREEPHSSLQQRADIGGNISLMTMDIIRKRKAPDSGYLSDQTKSSPAVKKATDAQPEEEGPLTIVTESSPEEVEKEERETKEFWQLPEPGAEPQSELTSDITNTFRTFQSELETHFTGCRKKVEAEVSCSLMECQQHVSSLLTAVHQRSLESIQMFGSSISDHLKRLEERASALKSINTEILTFFQLEKQRLGTFCEGLLLGLKSLDGAESNSEPPANQ